MENHMFRAARLVFAGLLLLILVCFPAEAREDSARLVFEKTPSLDKTLVYVVKKGDSLAGILRKQRGELKKKVPYDLIRQLNPDIKDLNRIYPGQKIVLPVRETTDPGKLPNDLRKKDSPLPPKAIRESHAPSVESVPPAVHPAESDRTGTSVLTPPRIEHILGFIRPVINRMKGTLIAKGNYFIPLKDTAQITIDCSLIPVVELDDGATVLLDFGNRLSEGIKGMIGQAWTNYGFVPREELGSGIAVLKAIIHRSRNYAMSEAGSPITLMQKPEIQVFPDWTVTTKKGSVSASYRQGLFLLGDNEKPLPGEARSFLEKNGLVVTEISGDQAVTGPPSQKVTPLVIDLGGLKGIALAERLLRALGETPVMNAEVVILDQVRNGITLSFTTDLLLLRGEKRFIIHTNGLHDQFVRILKEEGAEVILIGESGSGRPFIEALLQGLRIPIPFGHFSFRVPETNSRPRLTATFSALRVTSGGEPLYLIDFDMSSDILTLLRGLLGSRVVKY
jgi:LysM repeat protein